MVRYTIGTRERKPTMSDKVYEIITDRILGMLDQGVVPWRQPWSSSLPKNLVSGKEYRGVNVFLLGCQAYTSPWWVTYKQCAARGGQVRKGERSTPVIFWKPLPRKDATPADIAKGRDKFFLLRYYNVFNVAQCDNLEAPTSHSGVQFNPIGACEEIVASYKGAPPITHGGNRACYIPSQDAIQMPPRESFTHTEEYYSTLFHELTHSTGHKDRLDREGITNPIKFASHDYSFEELVAECGAAFLCAHAGIDNRTLDNSAAYIKHWSDKLRDNRKWIVDAAAKAAKAADHIRGVKHTPAQEESGDEAAA